MTSEFVNILTRKIYERRLSKYRACGCVFVYKNKTSWSISYD